MLNQGLYVLADFRTKRPTLQIQKLGYFIQLQSRLLRLSNKQDPFNALRIIESVPGLGSIHRFNQAYGFIITNGRNSQTGPLCHLAYLHTHI